MINYVDARNLTSEHSSGVNHTVTVSVIVKFKTIK
jgi:hypothetical protein